jgi:hypothetical protein
VVWLDLLAQKPDHTAFPPRVANQGGRATAMAAILSGGFQFINRMFHKDQRKDFYECRG